MSYKTQTVFIEFDVHSILNHNCKILKTSLIRETVCPQTFYNSYQDVSSRSKSTNLCNFGLNKAIIGQKYRTFSSIRM